MNTTKTTASHEAQQNPQETIKASIITRYVPIIVKTILCALGAGIVWLLVFHQNHISFPKEAENPLLFIQLTFLSIVYAICAGYAVNAVLTEYKEITRAVTKGDLATFLLYRDEQLPLLIHLLMGGLSTLITATVMLFYYDSARTGMFVVSSIVGVLALVYFVVSALDDYDHSIWFKSCVPHEWYHIDAKQHFAKERANNKQLSEQKETTNSLN